MCAETEDLKLMNKAASVAGFKIQNWLAAPGNDCLIALLSTGSFWQPLYKTSLTDRLGDAMRVAIALEMSVAVHDCLVAVLDKDGNVTTSVVAPEGDTEEIVCRTILEACVKEPVVETLKEPIDTIDDATITSIDSIIVECPTFVVECPTCRKYLGIATAKGFSDRDLNEALFSLRELEQKLGVSARRLPHDTVVSLKNFCHCLE